ncbi:MAG: hypothetical protein NTW16_16005 [Bacteroidetes bacterium]|nr:hypothetical protein [Bacteroidota bacterium]
MTNLEKYVKNHLEEFNSHEPDQGHFKRFEDRLNEQSELKSQVHSSFWGLKIAALILVMISVSVFVFDLATREVRERFSAEKEGAELPLEIREAVQYYDNQSVTQIATLNRLAANHADAGALGTSVLKEIQSLDHATEELKNSLHENPGNERILDAIIRNQQMKETMLNTIITQLSQVNN